jgi:GNAT superfamily N-acetyltransferase
VLLVLDGGPGEPPVGCVWLEPVGDGVAWYLGMLTVRPHLQDRQLGRTLLGEAEAWAAQAGARRIRMTVVGIRDSLIAWYQRRGYVLTGETQPFPYENPEIGSSVRRDLDFVVLEKAI